MVFYKNDQLFCKYVTFKPIFMMSYVFISDVCILQEVKFVELFKMFVEIISIHDT